MATRSVIGVMHGDLCKAVYCHWDGYLAHNGKILYQHYNSVKANELVSIGDLSSLGKDIGVKHPFSSIDAGISYEDYNALYSDMCNFYGRDRGEEAWFKTFLSYDELLEYYKVSGVEYIYIMKDNVWYVDQLHGDGLELLAEALAKDKEFA